MPLDETTAKLFVSVLVVAQVAALVAGARRSYRFGGWAGFLCASLTLGICFFRMGPNIQWSSLRWLEMVFLVLNAVTALASLLLIRTSGRPPALFWSVWLANSCSVAMMVYLAFFFSLF